jgi:hypothetical protein
MALCMVFLELRKRTVAKKIASLEIGPRALDIMASIVFTSIGMAPLSPVLIGEKAVQLLARVLWIENAFKAPSNLLANIPSAMRPYPIYICIFKKSC